MIRAARAGEEDALLALLVEAGAVPSATDDAASIRRLMERDPDATLVAERDGRIVGLRVAGWDGWRGNLYRLAVAPDQRRRGVATRLVHAAEQRFDDLGAKRIAVLATGDAGTRAFWAALGYRIDDAVTRFTKNR